MKPNSYDSHEFIVKTNKDVDEWMDGFFVDGTSVCMSPQDAKLIAAAPDLLEALEAITNLYAEEMYSERSCKEEDLPEVMLARAAIAKAKGEPQ